MGRRAAVCFVAVTLALACSRPAQLVYEAEARSFAPWRFFTLTYFRLVRERHAAVGALGSGRQRTAELLRHETRHRYRIRQRPHEDEQGRPEQAHGGHG